MAFRIQDLMTDVLPGTIRWASCPGGTTCAGGGRYAAASNKGDKSPQCRPVSRRVNSPKPNPKPGPQQDYTGLNLLHRQLRQALDGPRA